MCRRPDGERPYPGPVRPLGGTADGPVPPHRRHPHGRGRLGSAGRDAGPLRRGAQVRSGPAGRGPAAFCRGQGRRVRYLPEGQPPAAAAGSVPPTGPGGGVRPRQVPPAADAGGGGDPCPHPEAQARGGCAGGRPGPGGGPEAGRGGGRGRDPVSFIMFLPCPA